VTSPTDFDPQRDLVVDRVVPITPQQVWAAWTMPEHLTHWFTPAPWVTLEAEVDLRPGGIFRTVMQGPDGEQNHNLGCYLEVVGHRRLVWTGALGPGFRPNDFTDGGFPFTAEITLEPAADGTRYIARVMHANPSDKATHETMGFAEGWGAALDQLVAHMVG
jgi:uncharacterized protein YndB with AHSA1/START domain